MRKEISLMDRKIDLLHYLPPVIGEVQEFEKIAEVENPKFQRLWTALDGVLKDQFVADATIHGVKRWEKMLGIYPKDTESLEARRQRILARLGETLPYTYRRLEAWLQSVCGEEMYSLHLEHEIYKLTMELVHQKDLLQREIYWEARKMVPANITLRELVTQELETVTLHLGMQENVAVYASVEPYYVRSAEGTGEGRLRTGLLTKYSIRAEVEPLAVGGD